MTFLAQYLLINLHPTLKQLSVLPSHDKHLPLRHDINQSVGCLHKARVSLH